MFIKIKKKDRQKFVYLACPFCGRSFLLESLKPKSFESFSIHWKILQVREQHGNWKIEDMPKGFTLVQDECLDIIEMNKKSEYQSLVKKIKNRLIKILAEYMKYGIITMEDLKNNGVTVSDGNKVTQGNKMVAG